MHCPADGHRGSLSAVNAVSRLSFVEHFIAGLVGLDGNIGEVPAQDRLPTVLELARKNSALQLVDRRRHCDPALPHLYNWDAIGLQPLHQAVRHVRIKGDLLNVQRGTQFPYLILDRGIVDRIAVSCFDMPIGSPGRIRNLVNVSAL